MEKCSELTLEGQKFNLDVQKPYFLIRKLRDSSNIRIEPSRGQSGNTNSSDLNGAYTPWLGTVERIRDFFIKHHDSYFPFRLLKTNGTLQS